MQFRKLYILLLLTLFSCSNDPYDTSTPENFVISLGLIGQQPENHNPLPYFYEKESADAILAFDTNSKKGLDSFDEFRSIMALKFPNHIKTNKKGKIKIALDGKTGLNTRNFTFSASLIGEQMKERKPTNYEFISATKPDSEGISQLNLKILGNITTIPIKKTKNGYRMFSTEKTMENISKSIAKTKQIEEVFSSAIKRINSGEITQENFKEKMEEISNKYFKVVG